MISCAHTLWKNPNLLGSPFLRSFKIQPNREIRRFNCWKKSRICRSRGVIVCGLLLPVDPWAPSIDSQSIDSQLFAVSLLPYLGFLYFITKSKSAPKLTLFGFYFLLAFVGATIPAGIYAKVHYGTSLSNMDWLHGNAESLLTLTNLFIVLGLRKALKEANNAEESTSNAEESTSNEKSPLIWVLKSNHSLWSILFVYMILACCPCRNSTRHLFEWNIKFLHPCSEAS